MSNHRHTRVMSTCMGVGPRSSPEGNGFSRRGDRSLHWVPLVSPPGIHRPLIQIRWRHIHPSVQVGAASVGAGMALYPRVWVAGRCWPATRIGLRKRWLPRLEVSVKSLLQVFKIQSIVVQPATRLGAHWGHSGGRDGPLSWGHIWVGLIGHVIRRASSRNAVCPLQWVIAGGVGWIITR